MSVRWQAAPLQPRISRSRVHFRNSRSFFFNSNSKSQSLENHKIRHSWIINIIIVFIVYFHESYDSQRHFMSFLFSLFSQFRTLCSPGRYFSHDSFSRISRAPRTIPKVPTVLVTDLKQTNIL